MRRGEEPHTDIVLESACRWANGLSSAPQIVAALTQATYDYFNATSQYNQQNPPWAPYQMPNSWTTPGAAVYFFPYNTGLADNANCMGAADYVNMMATALGVNTNVIQMKLSSGANFSTTSCKPFGSTYGYAARSFILHQVVYYNSHVFDPTAKFANNGSQVITDASQSTYLQLAIDPAYVPSMVWTPNVGISANDWHPGNF